MNRKVRAMFTKYQLFSIIQGGATTTLVIHHADVGDAGTYSLKAENR